MTGYSRIEQLLEVEASPTLFRHQADGVHIQVDSCREAAGVIYVHARYGALNKGPGSVAMRHAITLGDRALAKVVLYHHASPDSEVQISSAVEIRLGMGAELTFIEVTETEAGMGSTIDVTQQGGSVLRGMVIDLNNSRLERTQEIKLEGTGAKVELGGLYVIDGSERADNRVSIRHLVENCHSDQLFKGIAAGQATGGFAGHIYVAAGAQRTVARQENHNLALGDGARVASEPQLEIYADDVQCSHGATVGRLDPEAIYYMRQRGIGLAEAKRLQIAGFAAELVERCELEDLRRLLEDKIARRLHG